MNKIIITAVGILIAFSVKAQQKVIPLYPSAVKGSESWTWNEEQTNSDSATGKIVYNVSNPTLTVFPPDPAVQSTGTAVIICPGGGFQILAIDKEGTDVANWLIKKGITVFVLKYRLTHSLTSDPVKEIVDQSKKTGFEKDKLPIIPLAVADGKAAVAYVRNHAAAFNVLPNKIGIVGFSAGGTIAISTATDYTAASRPDFAGAIYPYATKRLLKDPPANAPALFIAAASNDKLNKNDINTSLYNAWIKTNNIAEMHLYEKGGHGFGMSKQNFASDNWIDRFTDWMKASGYLEPISHEKTEAQIKAENWANFQKYFEDMLHTDWAWVIKYDDANKKLLPPAPGENRVVFMGNSITENWGNLDTAFFKNNHYISRGIGGQVSSQMLVRFREDVVNLKPAAVVIAAGTNDIAQNRGYISLENIFGNIASMAEMSIQNGIKPILTSVLPATEFSWHKGLEPAEKIIALNKMIKAYAVEKQIAYVDYWSAMVNDKNGLKVELAEDGLVHPNIAGYLVMEPLVKKAIDETLRRK